jgi:hypothetical protein
VTALLSWPTLEALWWLLVASNNVGGNKKFRELYHRRRSRRSEAKAIRTPVCS